MSRFLIAISVAIASLLGVLFYKTAPEGLYSFRLLTAQDDPVALADTMLERRLTSDVAAREIVAALDAGDTDLAQSMLELTRDRAVVVDPALAARVEGAVAQASTIRAQAVRFGQGFVSGEPEDVTSFIGSAAGDLFIYGDLRDAYRESSRLAKGEAADQLMLGLAAAGLAVTAGTYFTFGGAAPARAGLSLFKAARKTGRISQPMVDIVTKSARSAGKADRTLLRMASDIGQIQSKAGTRAALDGLKLSDGPKDVAKIARLADAKGGKTRAILKLLGRGAISLTVATMNLFSWVFWALMNLFWLVAALKRIAERTTLRAIARRKARMRKRHLALDDQAG